MDAFASLWRLAWPLILSNISVPLLGMVDVAVVGGGMGGCDPGADEAQHQSGEDIDDLLKKAARNSATAPHD